MEKDIFEAARALDLATVESHIRRGANLATENDRGFTALHCAAMGCSTRDEEKAVAMIDLLLKAGSPVNTPARDGRTPLYLAAEFSWTLGPLKRLVAANAEVDIRSPGGVHIVVNAMTKEAKEFLSALTGHPIPPPRVELKSIKLNAAEWRAAKVHLDNVFQTISKAGILVLQDAGTTQEDGFSDCSQEFREKGGSAAGLHGFCFYTRQDLNRAKRSSQLSLAFWGAPDGEEEAMLRVARQVVDAFREYGFVVDWNGSQRIRPTIYLQNIGQKNGEQPSAGEKK